jgi:signal transduction histidine kinase
MQPHVKSQILTNVSHELRTPLNGVVGLAELLLDSSLTKDNSDILRTTLLSAKSLQSVIKDLLDLSNLEAEG